MEILLQKFEIVEQIVKQLNNKNETLEQTIKQLNNKLELFELQNKKRNESFYQKCLEKHFDNKSHKVTKYGITDITTDTHHIEIKRWNDFKKSMGQLICYNHNDNKKLIVAFFGEYKKNKNDIIELFHSKDIEVWDLIDTENDIEINKFLIKNNQSDFFNWCDENIQYKENSILKLSDVCELYIGKKVPSRISTKLRKDIEDYINKKFSNINHLFQHTTINSINYRGWLHLQLSK